MVMIFWGDCVKKTDILHYITQTGKAIPISIANTFFSRFMGLMFKEDGEYGMLLSPCNSIHTFFMRYNLDAIFLDKDDRIISIKRFIKPYSIVPSVRKAKKVLEFPSSLHASAFLNIGDKLTFHNSLG